MAKRTNTLAIDLVRRAARTWAGPDEQLAVVYQEEWAALVDECPSRPSKLVTALAFFARSRLRAGRMRLCSNMTAACSRMRRRSQVYAIYGIGTLTMIAAGSAGLGLLSAVTDLWEKQAYGSWQWAVRSIALLGVSVIAGYQTLMRAGRARRAIDATMHAELAATAAELSAASTHLSATMLLMDGPQDTGRKELPHDER